MFRKAKDFPTPKDGKNRGRKIIFGLKGSKLIRNTECGDVLRIKCFTLRNSSIFQPDALSPSFFSPGNLLLGIFGRSTHRPTQAKSCSAVSGLPAKWNNSLWARKSQRIIKRTLQSHQLPAPRAKAQGHLLVPQGTSAELPPLRCTLVFGHERGMLPTLEPQRQ